MTHGSALSAISFQENIVSDLSAISMPIDLDRSNHVIVKRITNKVMLRGIEKRRIVDDHEGRQNFVKRPGDLAEETETRIPRVRSEIAER
jgi:hypothetical protein